MSKTTKASEQGHWKQAHEGVNEDLVWVWDLNPETHGLEYDGGIMLPLPTYAFDNIAPAIDVDWRGNVRIEYKRTEYNYNRDRHNVTNSRRVHVKDIDDAKAKAEAWLDRKVKVVAVAPTKVRDLEQKFKTAAATTSQYRSKIENFKRQIEWYEGYLAEAKADEAKAKAKYVKACKAAGVEPMFEDEEV